MPNLYQITGVNMRISSGMKKFLISLLVFLILVTPVFSLAVDPQSDGLVPCGKGDSAPCGFNDFMVLIDTVTKFILFDLAIPIAAIMFVYAGVSLIIAPGAEGRTKAKNIFTNTILGLIFAAGGWLIIRTLLSILGYKGDWIGF